MFFGYFCNCWKILTCFWNEKGLFYIKLHIVYLKIYRNFNHSTNMWRNLLSIKISELHSKWSHSCLYQWRLCTAYRFLLPLSLCLIRSDCCPGWPVRKRRLCCKSRCSNGAVSQNPRGIISVAVSIWMVPIDRLHLGYAYYRILSTPAQPGWWPPGYPSSL